MASGATSTHSFAANQHLSVLEISENQRQQLTPENQGTHSLYLALDCKCAFGATKEILYKIDGQDPTSENSIMVQKISEHISAPRVFGPPEVLDANFLAC